MENLKAAILHCLVSMQNRLTLAWITWQKILHHFRAACRQFRNGSEHPRDRQHRLRLHARVHQRGRGKSETETEEEKAGTE